METIQAILAVCGGISVIGGAVAVIHKWISPAIKLTTRVKSLKSMTSETLKRCMRLGSGTA